MNKNILICIGVLIGLLLSEFFNIVKKTIGLMRDMTMEIQYRNYYGTKYLDRNDD